MELLKTKVYEFNLHQKSNKCEQKQSKNFKNLIKNKSKKISIKKPNLQKEFQNLLENSVIKNAYQKIIKKENFCEQKIKTEKKNVQNNLELQRNIEDLSETLDKIHPEEIIQNIFKVDSAQEINYAIPEVKKKIQVETINTNSDDFDSEASLIESSVEEIEQLICCSKKLNSCQKNQKKILQKNFIIQQEEQNFACNINNENKIKQKNHIDKKVKCEIDFIFQKSQISQEHIYKPQQKSVYMKSKESIQQTQEYMQKLRQQIQQIKNVNNFFVNKNHNQVNKQFNIAQTLL